MFDSFTVTLQPTNRVYNVEIHININGVTADVHCLTLKGIHRDVDVLYGRLWLRLRRDVMIPSPHQDPVLPVGW